MLRRAYQSTENDKLSACQFLIKKMFKMISENREKLWKTIRKSKLRSIILRLKIFLEGFVAQNYACTDYQWIGNRKKVLLKFNILTGF